MRFFALTFLLLVVAGCRPQTPNRVNGELRVESSSLEFGDAWLGQTKRASVEISNVGDASLRIQLSLSGDGFSPVEPQVELASGEVRLLELTFAPATEGAHLGELTLTSDEATFTVALQGNGVRPSACPSEACARWTFSFETGACERTQSPDDTACIDACNGTGVCVSGECRSASAPACDDGNLCTVDACGSDGGCVHFDAPITVSDPCLVYRCEPDAGVVSEPAEDGLRCGDDTCLTRNVCINGSCVERPSGNAADDCRFVDVDACGQCFVTANAKLRCFGSLDGGPIGFNFIPDAVNVKKAVCGNRWLDADDRLQPRNLFADAGYEFFREVRTNLGIWHAVTTDGAYLVRNTASDIRVVEDAGVAGLCGENDFVWADGGVRLSSGAVDCMSNNLGGYTLAPNGDLRRHDTDLVLTGVTRLGRYKSTFVMRGAEAWGLRSTGEFTLRAVWPQLPAVVSGNGNFTTGLLCGVAGSGDAWCLGGLPGTRFSTAPNAPNVVAGGPWAQIEPLRRGDDVFGTLLYANVPLPDAGESSVYLAHHWSRRVTTASDSCVLSDGSMWCLGADGGEALVADDVVSLEDTCGVTSGGTLVCSNGVRREGVRAPSGSALRLLRDGGVETYARYIDGGVLEDVYAETPVMGSVTDLSSPLGGGGCYAASGSVWCVRRNGTALTKVQVGYPARRVVGHLEQGCAVIGANRVECWGMAPRFRVLQFDREIVDIGSSGGITDSSPWACVLLRGGEARCFGENWFGGIGIVPNRGDFFEKVDQ